MSKNVFSLEKTSSDYQYTMAAAVSSPTGRSLVRALSKPCDSTNLDVHTADSILDIFGNSVVKFILDSCDIKSQTHVSEQPKTCELHNVGIVSNALSRPSNGLINAEDSAIKADEESPKESEVLVKDKLPPPAYAPSTDASVLEVVSETSDASNIYTAGGSVDHELLPSKPLDARPKVFPAEKCKSNVRTKSKKHSKLSSEHCEQKVAESQHEEKTFGASTKKNKSRTKSTKKWKVLDITEFGFDFSHVSRYSCDANIAFENMNIDPEPKSTIEKTAPESDDHSCCSPVGDAEYFLALGIDVFASDDNDDCDPVLDWDGLAFGVPGVKPTRVCSQKTKSTHKKENSGGASSSIVSKSAPVENKNECTSFSSKPNPVFPHDNRVFKKCDKLALYELECSSRKKVYIRRDKHRRVEKAHKAVKSKHCRSIFNNRGRKTLYMHHRLVKMHNLCLDFRYFQRQGRVPPMPKTAVDPSAAKEIFKANQNTAWAGPTHRAAPAQNLRHTLHESNAPSHLEMDLASFLISLQHREMTPEDYDMLLRLDDSVRPKTVSMSVLDSLKTDTVGPDGIDGDADILCAICMEPYAPGDRRKFLPCDHHFHVACVDTWLNNSSMNCPLDGLPVDSS